MICKSQKFVVSKMNVHSRGLNYGPLVIVTQCPEPAQLRAKKGIIHSSLRALMQSSPQAECAVAFKFSTFKMIL